MSSDAAAQADSAPTAHSSYPASVDAPKDKLEHDEAHAETKEVAAAGEPVGAAQQHWSVIPDGGLHAWMTVAGGWLVMFATFGFLNAFGVFEDFYVRAYITNETPSTIAWIGSVQLCLQFCIGILIARAFDEGYFHVLVWTGSTIYIVCTFMLSLAKPMKYYQFLLSQGIGSGLGVGFLFLPTVSIIAHHFDKKRALAMGIVFTGVSASGLIFPIVLNKFFHGKVGFPNGVRICGAIMSVVLIAGCALMRTRLPPKSKMLDRPPQPNVLAFFKEKEYVMMVVGVFLIHIGIFYHVFYIQLAAATHGVEHDLAFDTITILNASSAIGRVLPNFIADKFGIFNVTITSALLCAALIVASLGFDSGSTAGVICVAVFYGFFYGTYISLLGPLTATLAKSVHEIGIRTGIVFLFLGLAALLGTPVDGALIGDGPFHYDWWKGITFSAVMIVAGALALTYVRFLLVKQKGTPYV
ncbi:MFS general substrate transporter [Auricularia subglabra TFB-10046 SS5]|nr:MFS general substrate transporter [Auricularia subglabra TFB-10046 SS5]